jgi:hypothetical protein
MPAPANGRSGGSNNKKKDNAMMENVSKRCCHFNLEKQAPASPRYFGGVLLVSVDFYVKMLGCPYFFSLSTGGSDVVYRPII